MTLVGRLHIQVVSRELRGRCGGGNSGAAGHEHRDRPVTGEGDRIVTKGDVEAGRSRGRRDHPAQGLASGRAVRRTAPQLWLRILSFQRFLPSLMKLRDRLRAGIRQGLISITTVWRGHGKALTVAPAADSREFRSVAMLRQSCSETRPGSCVMYGVTRVDAPVRPRPALGLNQERSAL